MNISYPILLVTVLYGAAYWTTFSIHFYNLVQAIF